MQKKLELLFEKYLTPYFGTIPVINIKKSDILGFRSSLAKVTYGNNQECLSPSRINQIMTVLRMILDSASERYDFDSPYKNIKSLKEGRIEVTPFSLEEGRELLHLFVTTLNLITPSAFLRVCAPVKSMALMEKYRLATS